MELMNEQQAAAYLSVQPNTLSVWRSSKRYALPFIKVGAGVRYAKADLDQFLESRRVVPGDSVPKRKRSKRRAK